LPEPGKWGEGDGMVVERWLTDRGCCWVGGRTSNAH
jgi:hypothetical protein